MGAIAIFRQAHSPEEDTPLGRLFAATMRGNATMQSEANVKKVASEQMDANEQTSITIQNKNGTPKLTIKNADPSLVNGTQQQELEDARDTPHLAVANASAKTPQTSADDPLAPMYDLADRQFGQRVPRPSDPDIAEKLKSPEGIRALTVEMGGDKRSADTAIRALKDGRLTIDTMRERVAAFRAKKIQAMTGMTPASSLNESQDMAARAQNAAAHKGAESNQQLTHYLTTRNQLLDQKNIIQYGDEDSFVNDAEKAMQPVGGFKDGDRDLFARAFKTGRVSFLNDRVKALSGEEGKLAIDSYGNSPAEINRFVEEQAGVDPSSLSRAERTRLARTATGLIQYKKEKAQKEADAQRRMQQSDERIANAMREKPEKPRKMTSFDSTNASSDALLSAVGDPAFEQTSVKQAINDKAGKIKQRLSELDAAMKGNAVEHGKLAPIIYDGKGQIKPGSEQANPFIFTRVMDAENKGKKWATEADSLKAELAKLSGTSAPQTASVPQGPPPVNQRVAGKTTYTFPSGPYAGKTGTWDGKAWANPQ